MIENWKKAYRLNSVRIAVALAFVSGLEPYVPWLASILPTGWVPVVAVAIVVARLVTQKKLHQTTPDAILAEAEKLEGGAK